MKSMARNSIVALLGISGLLALPASAEIGIYGGLQAGYSTTDTDEDIIELDDDTAYGIYAGYKFNDWFGLEVGYSRLGTFDIESTYGEDITAADGNPAIEINSLYTGISLWGKFVGPLNVYAKLGGHYSESRLEKSVAGEDFNENSYSFYYAAGLALPVADFLSITLSYQNFRNIDLLEDSEDSDLGEAGVDTANLGVLFSF